MNFYNTAVKWALYMITGYRDLRLGASIVDVFTPQSLNQ